MLSLEVRDQLTPFSHKEEPKYSINAIGIASPFNAIDIDSLFGASRRMKSVRI